MIPVPGVAQGTPFGARSRLWSCGRNAAGEGIHTGVDFPADIGTLVVAARPGVASWDDHGSAFGNHQLEVRCDDGTRDFYAHMSARTAGDGERVDAGQPVGRVGAEGNVTGPHLHFERHAVTSGPWSCSIIRDPQPSLDYQEDDMADQATQDQLDRIEALAKDGRDQVAALRSAETARAKADRKRDAAIAAGLDKVAALIPTRAGKTQVLELKTLLLEHDTEETP